MKYMRFIQDVHFTTSNFSEGTIIPVKDEPDQNDRFEIISGPFAGKLIRSYHLEGIDVIAMNQELLQRREEVNELMRRLEEVQEDERRSVKVADRTYDDFHKMLKVVIPHKVADALEFLRHIGVDPFEIISFTIDGVNTGPYEVLYDWIKNRTNKPLLLHALVNGFVASDPTIEERTLDLLASEKKPSEIAAAIDDLYRKHYSGDAKSG